MLVKTKKHNRKEIVLDAAYAVIELDFINFLKRGGNAEKYEIGYRVLRNSVANMLKPTKRGKGGVLVYDHDNFRINDAYFKNSLLSDDRFGFEKYKTKKKGEILVMVTLLDAIELAAKLNVGKVVDISTRRTSLPRKAKAAAAK